MKGKTRPGCVRRLDEKAHALQAYRSDSGTEFMPTLIDAGMGDGEGHLLSVQTASSQGLGLDPGVTPEAQ